MKRGVKNKLIEGVDNEVWTDFVGYCISNQVKVGWKISEILRDFLHKERGRNGKSR